MALRTGFVKQSKKLYESRRARLSCYMGALYARRSIPLVSRELKPLLPGASPKTYNLPYFVGFLLSYRRST